MASVKCPQCGLVNWNTASACERCGNEIASGVSQVESLVDDASAGVDTGRWSNVSAINREREEIVAEPPRTPERAASLAIPQQRQYTYKMVQIAPSLIVNANQHTGQEAANYLESIVNQWASAG
jgi:hypothetical protein